MKVLFNVSFIVIGVVIATFGEIHFVMTGFLYQIAGLIFEAIRLVMVQRLLSSAEFKMDPLVSLYYFAPICAVMNGIVSLVLEVPDVSMENIYRAGVITLIMNAMVAFLLNVSVVFLVRSFSHPSIHPSPPFFLPFTSLINFFNTPSPSLPTPLTTIKPKPRSAAHPPSS